VITNDVAVKLTWQTTGDDVSRFASAPISLRFELRNADLYGFQFN
jgi:hypothetical protein